MALGRTVGFLAVALVLGGSAVASAQEPAPPRPPVRVVPIESGYELYLNRGTTELLLDALARADEKEISGYLREEAKKRKETDPDSASAAKLELIAFLVNGQLPAFKRELMDKLGPGGVCIRVTGLQKPQVEFKRPVLNKAVGVVRAVQPLLPADAQAAVEGMRAMARTTPLSWKVQPLD